MIKNCITNKVYIGQSVNIKRRFKEHKERAFNPKSHEYNSLIHKAMRKYQLSNFSFITLEICNKEELDSKEVYWINYFDAANLDCGYNLTKGGNFSHNLILTEKMVCEIQNKLKSTTLTQQQIADEYSVTQRTISYINDGTLWYNAKNNYPLRERVKTVYLCSSCQKPIYRQSKLCSNCQNILNRKAERPDRSLLKFEIRNFCFSDLAKKYNVSATTIRRWCDYYNLPSSKKTISSFSESEWDEV